MRVKFKVRLDSSIYGYVEPGDVRDVPLAVAKQMMDMGYVESVRETKPQPDAPVTVKIPDDEVQRAIAGLRAAAEPPQRRGRRRRK